MDTAYKFLATDLVEEASQVTNLQFEVKYWNNQFHVLVDSRHRFAGDVSECKAYLSGVIAVVSMITQK